MGEAPFGAWPSPVSAELVVAGAARIAEVRTDGDDVWWAEARPDEGGRVVLVRCSLDANSGQASPVDVLPAGYSARTRVHEYGGGAWWVHAGAAYFTNWDDQRLYRLDAGADPRPITPEPERPAALRYADGVVTADGLWVICVRERHQVQGEAVNELVAVPATGGGEVVVLVSGPDFVSSPRISPDGDRLAWTAWDHPRMPWDGTELWTARLDLAAGRLIDPGCVGGGPDESIVQPEWTGGGELVALTDHTGWWNPWRFPVDGAGTPSALVSVEAEIGGPQWVFGLSWYAVLDDGRLVCSVSSKGLDRLGVVPAGGGELALVEQPFTALGSLRSFGGDSVVAVAAGPTDEPVPVRIDLPAAGGTARVDALRAGRDLGLAASWFSAPEPIQFPTAGGRTAHGLFYAPTNPEVRAPAGERPPLLVLSHGGPTSAARPVLNLALQFWTSRGFAAVDVNYGGSTGYGRPYRERLAGQWGVVDVADCTAAARWLAEQGSVDGARLAIRGGSAGGYTTLCALTWGDAFAAGASHYGVADCETLATDTHKFESRYLDGLIGPYPERRDLYVERSPIHHTNRLDTPLIVFQGDEDEVVPPAQAEMLVAALRAKGVPHAYLLFEGEQHGFRHAENIIRALEAELSFYGQVLGFTPAGDIEPVSLEIA